ncbi:cell division protein ZipA [Halomonadaceae bacterium KBTZ08]
MSLREWLIIVGALLIIGIVVDGLRRMRRARRESLEMQRAMGGDGIGQSPVDEPYNPELPTGGARPVGGAGGRDANQGAAAGRNTVAEAGPTPEPGPSADAAPPNGESEEVPTVTASAPEVDDEPLSAGDDDGIVGPARARDESTGAGEKAAEAGAVAGEAASRISAGAREIWNRIRDSAGGEDGEASTGAQTGGSGAVETPDPGQAAPEQPPMAGANRPEAEEVIVIHAHCRDGEHYTGSTIRRILEACGMEYGDLGIYHRHEESDTRTPVQFSVASAVSPGTLKPEEIESLETPGLSFFMSLPGPSQPVQAFDFMLETANTVVRNLGGELRDEHRSVMTSQTIEHCRQRIREFERKRRSPART